MCGGIKIWCIDYIIQYPLFWFHGSKLQALANLFVSDFYALVSYKLEYKFLISNDWNVCVKAVLKTGNSVTTTPPWHEFCIRPSAK